MFLPSGLNEQLQQFVSWCSVKAAEKTLFLSLRLLDLIVFLLLLLYPSLWRCQRHYLLCPSLPAECYDLLALVLISTIIRVNLFNDHFKLYTPFLACCTATHSYAAGSKILSPQWILILSSQMLSLKVATEPLHPKASCPKKKKTSLLLFYS